MSTLYVMVTITNRSMLPKFQSFFKEEQLAVSMIFMGNGTASNEILDVFGLEVTRKAMIFTIITDDVWTVVKKGLQNKLQIDVPRNGIAFIIPLSSIGGKRELLFLIGNQEYEKKEETTLKDTEHEVLLIIANLGYSNQIMDAAHGAGATGGTIVHAKGTGWNRQKNFLEFLSLLRKK